MIISFVFLVQGVFYVVVAWASTAWFVSIASNASLTQNEVSQLLIMFLFSFTSIL